MATNKLKNQFDDMFDEIYPPIKFGCLEYPASMVLAKVDPIAYRQEFLNWLDSEGLTDEYNQIIEE